MGVDHFFQDILLNFFNVQLKDASYLFTLLFISDIFYFFVVLIWQFSFTLVIICFSLLHVNLPKATKGFYIFFKKAKKKQKSKKTQKTRLGVHC